MADLVYALRQLAQRPGFSLAVIAMLSLGIGATTAIFTMFQQAVLQPLPVPEPEQLVNFAAPGPKTGSTSCSYAGECDEIFSYPMFRDLEEQQTGFAGLAAHRDFDATLADGTRAELGRGILVSGDYFSVLRLRPALGRLLGPEDEQRIGESAVVVLSHDYWQSRFGGDAGVLGRRLTVNGQALTIVGVAPRDFVGTITGFRAQVFVPLTLRWLMEPTRPRDEADRRAYWVYLFARLRPGTTIEQAGAGINALYRSILSEVEAPLNGAMPDEQLAQFRERQIAFESGARGQSWVPDGAERPLGLLLGITGVVLLIVCVNIANLLLARGAARVGELAVRVSMGASRLRLAALLLTEIAAPTLIGSLLSLPVAAMTIRALQAGFPQWLAGGFELEVNGTALMFAAAASLTTIVLFAAVPVLQATRVDPGLVIKAHAARSIGGYGMQRFRAALATVQIAFAMVLLVLAGLFTSSLANVSALELGMNVDSVVTFTVSPRMSGRSPEQTMQLFDRIEARLAEEPGVASVGSARIALLTRRGASANIVIDGADAAPGSETRALTNEVSTDFFRTLAIPLLNGRTFDPGDALGGPRVAVVNEKLVAALGLGADALGKRFSLGPVRRDIEIVGIVADTQYRNLKDEIPPQLFLPRAQNDNLDGLTYYIRAVDADTLQRRVPELVAAIDPDIAVANLDTFTRQIEDNLYLDRLVAMLSTAFAALATLLAALGLFGVLAYNVAQRGREFGLRLALGATPQRLRVSVLRQVGAMALIGGVAGGAAAVALGRVAEALLFGMSGFDPFVLLGAAVVLAGVVFVAAYLPARRAARAEPMEALRHD